MTVRRHGKRDGGWAILAGTMALHVRGTVLPDGVERDVLVTDAGRFDLEGASDAPTLLDGAFLIPGLVDAHCHLGLFSPAGEGASDDERARASAEMELGTGVLALREPGGPNHASTGLGPGVGLPRTFAAGRMLASPGGYVPGLGREVRAEDLPGACIEELGAGGGTWAKVIGDWVDADGVFRPNFPPEALAAAAVAVHAAGGRITAHVTLAATAEMVIDAGFDCIEHGDGITDALVARLADARIDWVPTLAIGVSVMPFVRALGATEAEMRRLTGSIEDLPRAVRLGSEAGVRILAGTDSGMLPHGRIAMEIASLAAAGLPTGAALAAGSWSGRAFLGLPGIEHGAPADLVAYARDPREDLSVLSEPLLIVLDGRVVGGTVAPRA